jgi:hypothetical protein
MGLFNKKKSTEIKKLPDLPELPRENKILLENNGYLDEENSLPDLEIKELPDLPEYPITEKGKERGLTKADIPEPGMEKSQFEPISSPFEEKPERSQLTPMMKKIMEPKQIIQKHINNTRFVESKVMTQKPIFKREEPNYKKDEPIYIRLDKFQNAVSLFEEIKSKIQEIERNLEKTKQVKKQEEVELEEWEKEIQVIKSKLDSIDKTIFNEIE